MTSNFMNKNVVLEGSKENDYWYNVNRLTTVIHNQSQPILNHSLGESVQGVWDVWQDVSSTSCIRLVVLAIPATMFCIYLQCYVIIFFLLFNYNLCRSHNMYPSFVFHSDLAWVPFPGSRLTFSLPHQEFLLCRVWPSEFLLNGPTALGSPLWHKTCPPLQGLLIRLWSFTVGVLGLLKWLLLPRAAYAFSPPGVYSQVRFVQLRYRPHTKHVCMSAWHVG